MFPGLPSRPHYRAALHELVHRPKENRRDPASVLAGARSVGGKDDRRPERLKGRLELAARGEDRAEIVPGTRVAWIERQRLTILADATVATRPVNIVDIRQRARDAAGRLLDRAITLSATDAAVWNNLGVIRIRRRQVRRGAEEFERGLALQPGNAELHRNLAVALDRDGQTAAANTQYGAFLISPRSIRIAPASSRDWPL